MYNEPENLIWHPQESKKIGGQLSEDTEMQEHHSDSESRGWNILRDVVNYGERGGWGEAKGLTAMKC